MGSKETKIELEHFNVYLQFDVWDDDNDEPFDETIKVDCYEDVETYMKLYINKKWAELFDDFRDIAYAEFKGIGIAAKDKEQKNSLAFLLFDKPYGTFTFDTEKLKDDNADKIAKIREIIGK